MKSPLASALIAGAIAAVISFLCWQQFLDASTNRALLVAALFFVGTALVTSVVASQVARRAERV